MAAVHTALRGVLPEWLSHLPLLLRDYCGPNRVKERAVKGLSPHYIVVGACDASTRYEPICLVAWIASEFVVGMCVIRSWWWWVIFLRHVICVLVFDGAFPLGILHF